MRKCVAGWLEAFSRSTTIGAIWLFGSWAFDWAPSWQRAVGLLAIGAVAGLAWAFVDPEPPRSRKPEDTAQ